VENDKAVWENDRMYELIGIARTNEPINSARFLSEIIHPDDAAHYRQAIARTLESGERFHFEGRFYRAPDRALRWIEFTGLQHLDVNGKPLRMVGTAADITEREEATNRLHNAQMQLEADIREKQRAEEDAQRLAADLAKANQRQNEFLATLAHELRNPLAPIRTGLDLMRISPENVSSVTKIRETMERQVDHLIHLVNDLMDLARIQSGKIELKKSLVPLKDIVLNAVETSLPVIQAKHHDFSVQVPDEPIYLNADANRMAQVLGNLLTNAAKYTPENGRIALLVQRAGDLAVIKVDDNGIGIPAEALPHLFQMFNQVHLGRDYAQGGLGIGLNLVKRLTEEHGGTVTAASAGTGQGSTFTLRLPIALPDPAMAQISEVPAQGVTELPPLRILIADDNREAAELLAQLLRSGGHIVQTAHDGPSALAAAEALHPELALLDIGMPGMNGYELAQAMRRVPELQITVLPPSQDGARRKTELGRARPALLITSPSRWT
jgi:PAS domain S-box-containing protein